MKNTSSSVIKISTRRYQWLVPNNCEYLKLLIIQENLSATDLRFASPRDCNGFIRQLFLLALEDEQKNVTPSCLAVFARALAKHNFEQTTL
ncbi:MAG: hypothetical protein P8J68_08580 [Arenicellaceae bacterium]|nr:hypothetical protein [Arenicellaceae bacterium]